MLVAPSVLIGVPSPSHGVGFDVMSRSHCTHPTGGLPVRLKHKNKCSNRGAASSQGVVI